MERPSEIQDQQKGCPDRHCRIGNNSVRDRRPKAANVRGIITGCITCNKGTELARVAAYPVEVVVGPEVVTGSTRMKAGTAQKLVLNMISTAVMIRMGHVKGNKMVDMQLTNDKLIGRGTRMLMEELHLSQPEAEALLKKYGGVRKALTRTK